MMKRGKFSRADMMRMIRLTICMVIILCFLINTNAVQAALQYNTNLIVNGNAEDGLNGWTSTGGGFETVAYGTSSFPAAGSPGPDDRGAYFFAGGNEAASYAEQTIDVSDGAAEIDSSQLYCEISGYLGGYYYQEDNATVTVRFISTTNEVLSSLQIGPVSAADRNDTTGLLLRSIGDIIPSGTRSIVIHLDMERDAGSYNDSYADNLTLILTQQAPPENLCSGTNLQNCSDEAPCTGAGGYWYDNACHSTPENTTGTKKVWDSWVYGADSTDSSTNHGASPYLSGSPISNCNTAMSIAYIKFDLNSFPETVDKVNLVVHHLPHTTYCYSNCSADFYFYPVLEPWDEKTITYDNKPTLGTEPVCGPIHISFPNDLGEQKYDITNIYRQWKNGTVPNYGLAIYSPTVGCNNASAVFMVSSSEDPDNHGPALEIISSPENICDAANLQNCSDEAPCTGAGGYWYDNACHSAPDNTTGVPNAAPNMAMIALILGDGQMVNPADTPVAVPAGPLFIHPTLAIPTADKGLTANLFSYIYVPLLETGYTFYAPESVTLGDEINFSAVFPDMIDFTGLDGLILDVYYGYTLNDGSIRYNAYEVTLGNGGGSDLEKSRTVGLGSDIAGFLDTSNLKILSNSGESVFSGSNSASIGFLHDDENVPNPTLLMVTNETGNPILLKMSDDPGDDFTAASTALAMVLYDPNILFLTHEDYVRVRTAVQADARLAALTSDIKALIQAHDPNPLDYDSHTEIYQQAVTIARDVLKDIAPVGTYGSFQSDNEIKPLEVADDKDHSTPYVVLTNRTMCYYDIKASKDGVPFSTYRIERRNLLDYHIVTWPLKLSPGVDFEVTSKVNVGDGNLSFAFEKQKKLTVVYCMLSTASTAIGVGSTKLADIEKGFEALANAGAEVTDLINKALTTKPNNQAEADKLAGDLIYGVFHSGYTLVSTVFETQIKEQLQHNFFKTAFKIAGSKMLVWATAGYAASDIAVTLWDLHHAPDTYSEEGYQVNGEYPVRLKITNVEPNNGKPGDEITVDFEINIPSQIIPAKLMLGDLEVGKIYDSNQQQMIFTVQEGAKTGSLKFTYGSAQSNGVLFTVGDSNSKSFTGERQNVFIDNSFPCAYRDISIAINANLQVNTATGISISKHDGYPASSLHKYFDVNLYTTTILFDLDPPQWTTPNQGNFTITLGNTPIKDVTADYCFMGGNWLGNVTFGKPYYTIDNSSTCSEYHPIDESGIEFSSSQEDNIITGSYLFPGSGEGAFVHLLLNIPYTVNRPDDPSTTEDESYTATGVCKQQGILLLFRNYTPEGSAMVPSDPCNQRF